VEAHVFSVCWGPFNTGIIFTCSFVRMLGRLPLCYQRKGIIPFAIP
jgi:hypothetical protein